MGECVEGGNVGKAELSKVSLELVEDLERLGGNGISDRYQENDELVAAIIGLKVFVTLDRLIPRAEPLFVGIVDDCSIKILLSR